MAKKTLAIVRAIILIIVGTAVLFWGGGYFYLKWRNTHGRMINVIHDEDNKTEVSETLLVIDCNVKSAILRAEAYVEQKDMNSRDRAIVVDKYLGRKPWKRFAVQSVSESQ